MAVPMQRFLGLGSYKMFDGDYFKIELVRVNKSQFIKIGFCTSPI